MNGGIFDMADWSLRTILVSGTAAAALCAMPGAAFAQSTPDEDSTTQPAATPTGAETPQTGADVTSTTTQSEGTNITITGSRIKQNPNNSALPLQIITNEEI